MGTQVYYFCLTCANFEVCNTYPKRFCVKLFQVETMQTSHLPPLSIPLSHLLSQYVFVFLSLTLQQVRNKIYLLMILHCGNSADFSLTNSLSLHLSPFLPLSLSLSLSLSYLSSQYDLWSTNGLDGRELSYLCECALIYTVYSESIIIECSTFILDVHFQASKGSWVRIPRPSPYQVLKQPILKTPMALNYDSWKL